MVILKAARAHAALQGRLRISQEDILLALELAIPHRLKRGPFADAQMSMAEVEKQMEQITSEWGEGDEADEQSNEAQEQPVKKKVHP
jgi:Mg-chelatase subunit ChlI